MTQNEDKIMDKLMDLTMFGCFLSTQCTFKSVNGDKNKIIHDMDNCYRCALLTNKMKKARRIFSRAYETLNKQ